jgi:hypothetical protein
VKPGAVVAPDRTGPDDGETVHEAHRTGVASFTRGARRSLR